MLYCLPFDIQFSFLMQNIIRLRKGIRCSSKHLMLWRAVCGLSRNYQAYTHSHYMYTLSHCIQSHVRPQGCQVQEHGCRQLLQLVAAKVQIPVEKKKVEKIIWGWEGLYLNFIFGCITKDAHIPFHTTAQVRPHCFYTYQQGPPQTLLCVYFVPVSPRIHTFSLHTNTTWDHKDVRPENTAAGSCCSWLPLRDRVLWQNRRRKK